MEYRIIDHTAGRFSGFFLNKIYVLSNSGQINSYGCVPNGEIGISVILSGNSHFKVGEIWKRQPEVSVYGLVRRPQFHRMSENYLEINLGFEPYMLQLLLKDKLYSLDWYEATPLDVLVDTDIVEELYQRISEARSDQEVLLAIEEFLRRLKAKTRVDQRILEAHRLIKNLEVIRVEELSQRIGISGTTMRSLFREHVGLTPKELIQIVRIKNTLAHQCNTEEDLTQLAYRFRYFDQSHFIHDFKRTIGMTPGEYFSNNQLTFDFYNYERWNYSSFGSILK